VKLGTRLSYGVASTREAVGKLDWAVILVDLRPLERTARALSEKWPAAAGPRTLAVGDVLARQLNQLVDEDYGELDGARICFERTTRQNPAGYGDVACFDVVAVRMPGGRWVEAAPDVDDECADYDPEY